MHAFMLSSPTYNVMVVNRYLKNKPKDFSLQLNIVHTERAFFSTTINYNEYENSHHPYLTLYVPKGTKCLYLVPVNKVESEVLFPPSTQYILYEEDRSNGYPHYFGMII